MVTDAEPEPGPEPTVPFPRIIPEIRFSNRVTPNIRNMFPNIKYTAHQSERRDRQTDRQRGGLQYGS